MTDVETMKPQWSSEPAEWPDDALLRVYAGTLEQVKALQDQAGRLEWEIRQRIETRNATAIPSDAYTCELQAKTTYRQAAFTPLKELLTADDLKSCYVEAHQATVDVPDKWNTVKVKALARRYGRDALAIVEKATVQEPGKLKFERKGE